MKTYFSLIVSALIVVFCVSSCKEDTSLNLYKDADNFHFSKATTSVGEDAINTVKIPVIFTKKAAVTGTVTFSVGGTAVEGTDYTIVNAAGKTLTYAIGDYSKDIEIRVIDNAVVAENKTIEVTLTSGSANIGYPGPDKLNSKHTVTIVEDDCPEFDIVGTYSSKTSGQSTDGCCPNLTNVTKTVTITLVSGNRYQISDFSGGLYYEWYDVYGIPSNAYPLPAFLDLTGRNIVITGNEPFGTAVTGTGLMSDTCKKILTLNWKNGYDDVGTLVMTKQ